MISSWSVNNLINVLSRSPGVGQQFLECFLRFFQGPIWRFSRSPLIKFKVVSKFQGHTVEKARRRRKFWKKGAICLHLQYFSDFGHLINHCICKCQISRFFQGFSDFTIFQVFFTHFGSFSGFSRSCWQPWSLPSKSVFPHSSSNPNPPS